MLKRSSVVMAELALPLLRKGTEIYFAVMPYSIRLYRVLGIDFHLVKKSPLPYGHPPLIRGEPFPINVGVPQLLTNHP